MSTCTNAARGGHLDVLQWARANRCRWDHLTCACAARAGHLEVLKWAISNGCPYPGPYLSKLPQVKEWIAAGVALALEETGMSCL